MTFSVDTSDVADAEIEAIFLSLNARNPVYAGRWLEGLTRFLEGLIVFPGRYAVVENADPRGREVRKALYRNGQTAY